jgi:SAM-dependent methyltransferase
MLSRLHADGRRKAFPLEIFWVLDRMESLTMVPVLNVLDVGSGPFSTLAHLEDVGRARVRAVDPLAAEYAKLIHERAYKFPVSPEAVLAEKLVEAFGTDIFDIVFFENSLDHTQSPAVAVDQAWRVLRPGGALIVKAMVHEGSNEGWHGLHKWDLFPRRERLMCRSRFGMPRDLVRSIPVKHVLTTYSRLYGQSAFVAAYRKIT